MTGEFLIRLGLPPEHDATDTVWVWDKGDGWLTNKKNAAQRFPTREDAEEVAERLLPSLGTPGHWQIEVVEL